MDKPTLMIGIGTSGLRVLEHVQSFYYESTGSNRPPHLQLLYLETDESAFPGVTALKNEIIRVHISLEEKETMINSLAADPALDTAWLPEATQVMDSGFGAGGLPAFGRVALWGQENFDSVRQQIQAAYERVANHGVKETNDSRPAVFITGSLTGGTGTGTFIDMAYMVRNLITDISEVFGLFLIPGRSNYDGNEVIYSNTYAAFKMLEHYNKQENAYTLKFPNGQNANFEEPPYEFVQFISQDYNDEYPSISSLGGLYKMAGMYLFLNAIGLRKKRMTRFGDAKANGHLDKYGTFGLSAIQYPKSQLEEHIAIQLSEELYGRWIDPAYYYRQGAKTPIENADNSILNGTKQLFEGYMREAFDALDGTDVEAGNKVVDDLLIQAKKLGNKEHAQTSDHEFIYLKFSSNGSGNYYTAIRNNMRVAEDIIIERIAGLITDAVNHYENLYVARKNLEAIVKAIDETARFWQNMKVSSKIDNWEKLLNEQCHWMLKNRFKLLGQADTVLADRMRGTLDLMKMHLFARKLIDIKKCIQEGEIPLLTKEGAELPTLHKISEKIRILEEVLGKNDESQKARKFVNLAHRRKEIVRDLQDSTIPIQRIYPAGTYEQELERGKERYRRAANISAVGKEKLMGERELWEYLNQSQDALRNKLYKEGISSFEQELRNHEAVPDMNISEFIGKDPQLAQKMARRSQSALLKINADKKTLFGTSHYIPRMIIGQDKAMVQEALDQFKEDAFIHYSDTENGIWVNSELRNMLVFYEERGYMQDKSTFEPLKHLRFIDEIKTIYEEYPSIKGLSPEKWHRLRIPYFPFDHQKVNNS